MAKIRDIKVKLTANTSEVRATIAGIKADMQQEMESFEKSMQTVAAATGMTPDEMKQVAESIKRAFSPTAQDCKDAMNILAEQANIGARMKPEGHMPRDKPKWNTEQILAEAHRVEGEHTHNRRKYRHDMSTTGCMRVPAALVVEMLGDKAIPESAAMSPTGKTWEDRWRRSDIRLAKRIEQINGLDRDIAFLKEQLKNVAFTSPEERVVIEAAKHPNLVIHARQWVDRDEPAEGFEPLYSAILALHEAGEHPMQMFKRQHFSDGEKEHIRSEPAHSSVNNRDWTKPIEHNHIMVGDTSNGFYCNRRMRGSANYTEWACNCGIQHRIDESFSCFQCPCGNTLHFA